MNGWRRGKEGRQGEEAVCAKAPSLNLSTSRSSQRAEPRACVRRLVFILKEMCSPARGMSSGLTSTHSTIMELLLFATTVLDPRDKTVKNFLKTETFALVEFMF